MPSPISLVVSTLVWAGVGAIPASGQAPLDRFDEVVKSVLEEEGVDGAFVLYDERRDVFFRFNDERSRREMPPASTFKIPNALIAVEEGLVADEDEIIPWDGVERDLEAWNQDQTLAAAMGRSTVWVFQEFARELGRERMAEHLDALGYGNGKIGEFEDRFWLDGSLLITPQQQVEFLRRLHHEDLPFAPRTFDIVKRILIQEDAPEFVLRGKTGWAIEPDPDVGWYVGYLERADNTYYFALNVDINKERRGLARARMTRDILDRLGLLSEAPGRAR